MLYFFLFPLSFDGRGKARPVLSVAEGGGYEERSKYQNCDTTVSYFNYFNYGFFTAPGITKKMHHRKSVILTSI
jgi:hypothetical protein